MSCNIVILRAAHIDMSEIEHITLFGTIYGRLLHNRRGERGVLATPARYGDNDWAGVWNRRICAIASRRCNAM